MAASANPSGNHEGSSITQQKVASSSNSTVNGVSVNPSNNGGSSSAAAAAVPTVSAETLSALRHNPGISAEWSAEEQSLLEELLVKFSSDSNIVRYAKIAMQLKDKTVRDVALRCRWKNPKENGKRRKEDYNSRKNKERKERVTDSSAKSSHLTTRPNGPLYAPPIMPIDLDDGVSYKAIGGVTGELLEQTSQMLNQISANVAAFQIHDNINLLCKTRDNILSILNDSNDAPEIMKLMPPLPVKMNDELANSILPQSSHQMKS